MNPEAPVVRDQSTTSTATLPTDQETNRRREKREFSLLLAPVRLWTRYSATVNIGDQLTRLVLTEFKARPFQKILFGAHVNKVLAVDIGDRLRIGDHSLEAVGIANVADDGDRFADPRPGEILKC